MPRTSVRKWLLLALSFAVSFAAIALSAEANDKFLMASLGDSVTAGTFANAPIPNWTRPLDRPLSRASHSSMAKNPEDELREWIHETFLPDTIVANKRKYSWASGEEILSHYVRLRDWLAAQQPLVGLERLNVSFPGDRTEKLEAQARMVAEAMASGAFRELAYVTILIGANDTCDDLARTPDQLAKISENIRKGLRVLNDMPEAERAPRPIRVLLSSLPRVPELGRPEITNHDTVFGISCRKVRDEIVKSCNPLTVWSSPDELAERVAIVDGVNVLLARIADQAALEFPRLEIVYSPALFQAPIELDLLAADCFHPNERGQETIADALWTAQPWFK